MNGLGQEHRAMQEADKEYGFLSIGKSLVILIKIMDCVGQ